MNAEPEVDSDIPPEVGGEGQILQETTDEVDLKIVGNGNEAELKVFLIAAIVVIHSVKIDKK
jgi:hypothetical protein